MRSERPLITTLPPGSGAAGRRQHSAPRRPELGCAVLAVRGGAGIVDDLTRSSGLLPNGITGLSVEQTMGTAHPSAHARWTSRATDAYFALGGLLFAVLAHRWSRFARRTAP